MSFPTDYQEDQPEQTVLQVFIKKDPETNEVLGPSTRRLTRREIKLVNQIEEIKGGVVTIFQERKDDDAMLIDIEKDVADLVAKVKRYLEGAK